MAASADNETLHSDNELVDRCLQNDQAAWAQLITKYQRLIYSVARTLCFDAEDVADVFQATCLDLYQQLSEVRDIQALPAWLITVTRRRAASSFKARLPILETDDELDAVTDVVRAIEREHSVERALEQLSPRCRELIDLLYLNAAQHSYAEISKKLAMPVASIGPTRARCLERLKKLLA